MMNTSTTGNRDALQPRVKLALVKRESSVQGKVVPALVPQLSGEEIRRLMRVHGRTIRSTAQGMGITMKRVREVRDSGVQGDLYVWEWGTYLAGKTASEAA